MDSSQQDPKRRLRKESFVVALKWNHRIGSFPSAHVEVQRCELQQASLTEARLSGKAKLTLPAWIEKRTIESFFASSRQEESIMKELSTLSHGYHGILHCNRH